MYLYCSTKPSLKGHDDREQYIPELHGVDGPLLTSVYGWPGDVDDVVLATTEELSDEFPWNPDYNSGNMLGVSWMHSKSSRPSYLNILNVSQARLVDHSEAAPLRPTWNLH